MILEQTSIYEKLQAAAIREVVQKLTNLLALKSTMEPMGYTLRVFITPVYLSKEVGMVLVVNITLSNDGKTSLFGTDINLVLKSKSSCISIDGIGELKPDDIGGLFRNVMAGILSGKILSNTLCKEIDITDGAICEFLEFYKNV